MSDPLISADRLGWAAEEMRAGSASDVVNSDS